MPEKVRSITLADGTVYENPIILWPLNWRDTDREFMTIRTEDNEEIHLRVREVVKEICPYYE